MFDMAILYSSQTILENTEQRLSRVREDLATTKEHLHATSLNRDVLEQEKNVISMSAFLPLALS